MRSIGQTGLNLREIGVTGEVKAVTPKLGEIETVMDLPNKIAVPGEAAVQGFDHGAIGSRVLAFDNDHQIFGGAEAPDIVHVVGMNRIVRRIQIENTAKSLQIAASSRKRSQSRKGDDEERKTVMAQYEGKHRASLA